MKKLEMYMLGNLKIVLDRKTITDNISYKSAGILSYLALNKERAFSRDKLSSLFWETSSMNAARYNLRYNLWALRKVLGDNKKESKIIDSQKDTCKFNLHNNVYIDVFHMESILKNVSENDIKEYIEGLEKAKNIYKGEFLEGFYIKDCPEFNDWIFFERERWQRTYFDILYKLSKIYKEEEKFLKSIDNLEEMLTINPLQEELYVKLIEIYLEMGDRSTALHQYERCCRILREELNVSPMAETKEVYKKIIDHSERELKDNKTEDRELLEDKWIIYNRKFTDKNAKIFDMDCYPIKHIQYYWISNLIKEIMDNYSIQVLEGFPEYYWKDIYRIESSVGSIIEGIDLQDNLTIITEKNKIFSATLELLYSITKENSLSIIIKNIQWMDEFSFDFLKLILFKYERFNLQFTITGDEEDYRFKEIKTYFKLKKF